MMDSARNAAWRDLLPLSLWRVFDKNRQNNNKTKIPVPLNFMDFFNSAISVLQTLVIALGAGLGIWGAINLLEGYGNDNRATRS